MSECAIYGCSSSSRDKSVLLFRFPKSDSPEYESWLSVCHESSKNIQSRKKPLICSKHFNQSDIIKRRLAKGALPALLLSPPLEEKARLAKIAAEQAEKTRIVNLVNDAVFEWVKRTRYRKQLFLSYEIKCELRRIATKVRDLIGATLMLRIDEYWFRKFCKSHMARLELMLVEEENQSKTLDLASIIHDLDPNVKILSKEEIETRYKELEMKVNELITRTKSVDPEPYHSPHTSLSSPKFSAKMKTVKKTSSFNDNISDYYSSSGDNIQGESHSSDNRFETNSEGTDCVNLSDNSLPDLKNSENSNQALKTESIPVIDSYQQALEYLKPLEDFALRQENYRAIGLLTSLEIKFKGPKQQH